jgi:hypothetical protein
MSSWEVERRQAENVTAAQQYDLTLILLTWRIWSSPNNASRWQMGFNSAFKGLNTCTSTQAGYAVLKTEAAGFSKHW